MAQILATPSAHICRHRCRHRCRYRYSYSTWQYVLLASAKAISHSACHAELGRCVLTQSLPVPCLLQSNDVAFYIKAKFDYVSAALPASNSYTITSTFDTVGPYQQGAPVPISRTSVPFSFLANGGACADSNTQSSKPAGTQDTITIASKGRRLRLF